MGRYLADGGALWENVWVIVTGGVLVTLDGFLTKYWPWWKDNTGEGKPFRRKIDYGLLIAAFLFAGFFAWQDQHTAAGNAGRERDHQLGRAEYWRQQAEQRQETINDLKARPPQVVDRPVYVPVGPAKSKHSAALQKSYEAGAQIYRLILTVKTSDEDVEKGNRAAAEWATSVTAYMRQNVSPAAAERFNQPSDAPPKRYENKGGRSEKVQETVNTVANFMRVRLENLQEIMNTNAWDGR